MKKNLNKLRKGDMFYIFDPDIPYKKIGDDEDGYNTYVEHPLGHRQVFSGDAKATILSLSEYSRLKTKWLAQRDYEDSLMVSRSTVSSKPSVTIVYAQDIVDGGPDYVRDLLLNLDGKFVRLFSDDRDEIGVVSSAVKISEEKAYKLYEKAQN